jgi:hypothetical protein
VVTYTSVVKNTFIATIGNFFSILIGCGEKGKRHRVGRMRNVLYSYGTAYKRATYDDSIYLGPNSVVDITPCRNIWRKKGGDIVHFGARCKAILRRKSSSPPDGAFTLRWSVEIAQNNDGSSGILQEKAIRLGLYQFYNCLPVRLCGFYSSFIGGEVAGKQMQRNGVQKSTTSVQEITGTKGRVFWERHLPLFVVLQA